MFNQLKILTLFQLSEIFDLKAKRKFGLVGRSIASIVISYGVFVALILLLKLLNIYGTLNIFIFVILLLQLVSIFSSTLSLSKSLYSSKDNALLLTYPVKHLYVYISKLLVAYIVELKRSLQLLLPLFIAYMTINSNVISVGYILMAIIYSVILPLFPVLIGAIIAIPVVYYNRLLKQSALVKTITLLIVLGIAVFITTWIIRSIPTPFNIRDLFLAFLDKMDTTFAKINKFGLYANWLGNAMYGNKIFLNNLWIILFLLGIGSASIAVSLPLFFKMASSEGEHAVQKKHGSKNITHNSTFLTFVRKEMLLSVRNIGDFISNYIFLFIMPFILLILAMIYVHIDRNYIGISLTYALIGLISLLLSSVSNTASATAISSEGKEFVLLKTSPGKSSNIVWAKLLINIIVSTFCLTISYIVLDIFLTKYIASSGIENPEHYYNSKYLWLVYGFVVLINIGLMMQSIKEDIVNPSFNEIETSGSMTNAKTFGQSISLGLISTLLFSVIVFVCYLLLPFDKICIILISVGILWVLICLYFLINYTKAYFDDIQI